MRRLRIGSLVSATGALLWLVLIHANTITQTANAQDRPKQGQTTGTSAEKAKAPKTKDPLEGTPNPDRKDVMQLSPPISGAALAKRAHASYEKGMGFVVGAQNKDGTWGSALPGMANLKDFGFKTTNKGSNDGVLYACTAIMAKALLRDKSRSDREQRALDRAIDALLSTQKFAYSGGEAFNTWGYGFKLDFLVDYYLSDEGKDRRDETRAAAKVCIDGLKRYQLVDGGWNYYTGPALGGTSMSFNTANFMQALERARKAGLEVPKGMVHDAGNILLKMETRRGTFVYDARFVNAPRSVNELSSASRTAAATEALVEVGRYGLPEMQRSLRIFNEGENWLEDGRKLIQPHTAVHQVSGYFFFYGYYYLSEFMARMGDDAPTWRWERNAWTMIRTQEEDGSWWDTPAAGYGDKWGTGFALLVLQRCAEAADSEAAKKPIDALESTPKGADTKASRSDGKVD